MRLATRLLGSHTALAGVLLLALAVTVVSLARMTSWITEVRDREFETLGDEEEVYRAAWAIEVAARHGITACENRQPEVAMALQRLARGALDERLARQRIPLPRRLQLPVAGYRDFARGLTEENLCARLLDPASRIRRTALDEELTDAWIERVRELHRVIAVREEQARRLGTRATVFGLGLGAFAGLAAVVLARWIARGVTVPLGDLARAAGKVGAGDFSPLPRVRGPTEVEALGESLDRMRERLAELDQLKQGFVAMVSHELRTPMARLREALALLEDGAADPLSARQRRVVQLARRACEKEIRVVKALLDLSRIRAGRALQLESGSAVDGVLREALEDESPEADERGVTLALEAQGETPRAAMDGALLGRAVANIVRNGVSVSARGQTVRVRREVVGEGPVGRGGSWARITIRDDGPGVPTQVRERLFEAFVTQAVGGQPTRDGVGLGLVFAREVLREHQGEVEFVDVPGPGATFVVWLPLDARAVGAEAA